MNDQIEKKKLRRIKLKKPNISEIKKNRINEMANSSQTNILPFDSIFSNPKEKKNPIDHLNISIFNSHKKKPQNQKHIIPVKKPNTTFPCTIYIIPIILRRRPTKANPSSIFFVSSFRLVWFARLGF